MHSLLSREGFIATFIALIAVASAGDLFFDLSHGVSSYHLLQEGTLLVLALVSLAYLGLEFRKSRRQLQSLRRALDEAKSLPPAQTPAVVNARQQLREAIAEQFELWQLTNSEREVGILLLKGLSLKEIALLRGTAEKTIRQQASSIYQKSGVSGRHAFSAWFIEDLM